MGLVEKTQTVINIVGDYKMVECEQQTWNEEDGVPVGEISRHNYVVSPGEDATSRPTEVQDQVALFHTPAVIADYKAFQTANTI
jgi:hypothetical protein